MSKAITIGFDPTTIKPEHECYEPFVSGGLALKYWVLYKSNHITNQYFKGQIDKLTHYFNNMFNDEYPEITPYNDIYEFLDVLKNCELPINKKWLIDNWDYFNLNIQKKLTISYKVVKEVDEEQII